MTYSSSLILIYHAVQTYQKKTNNYDKITKVLETLTSDVEMDFNSFLDGCKIDYTEYLNVVRSSISKKKVFLKRTVKDTRIKLLQFRYT